jgi:hypothetical protein
MHTLLLLTEIFMFGMAIPGTMLVKLLDHKETLVQLALLAQRARQDLLVQQVPLPRLLDQQVLLVRLVQQAQAVDLWDQLVRQVQQDQQVLKDNEQVFLINLLQAQA